PGLIEGAGEGVGLGHEFLRHVERCRLLLHVIDVSGSEGRDPIDDFDKINRELSVYSEELSRQKQIVVANKCDLCDEQTVERVRDYFEQKGYAFFPVMAAIGEGTAPLVNYVAAELQKLPPVKKYEAQPKPKEDYLKPKSRTFNIRVCEGVYMVEDAPWLPPLMNDINPEDYESLQYFERVLRASGIIDALRKSGISEGDTVSVYDVEFEYVE
ncbi:MAG: Obg family GTPase CgtA, partial [Clostridia bacterium]|nr:Obg family GTPase CgtA [Clostridia bacterium]